MKTIDFCNTHRACSDGKAWALSVSEDMADVWDAMIEQKKYDWLFWIVGRPDVFEDRIVRLLICRMVRETPLADGRTVWDLLTDERSRNAVIVGERFANGEANADELAAAGAAAWAAARAAAGDASVAAAGATARAAARDMALWWYDEKGYPSGTAAWDAQIRMVNDLGNPFKGARTKGDLTNDR